MAQKRPSQGLRAQEVIAMLNPLKNEIYAVRGNCEAEVDQMVLEFPVMADYFIFIENGKAVYATPRTHLQRGSPAAHEEGDVLLHGHTHVLKAERREGYTLLNPAASQFPKKGIQTLTRLWKTVSLKSGILRGIP